MEKYRERHTERKRYRDGERHDRWTAKDIQRETERHRETHREAKVER